MNTTTRLTLAARLFLLASTLCYSALGQPIVIIAESHFDDTNSLDLAIRSDGWRGINDANGSETRTFNLGGATTNSIGYISVSETVGDGKTLFFAAPAKFLGDKRAAYNGLLRLAHKQDATSQQTGGANFVLLGSSNVLLSFSLRGTPATSWSFHEIPLNENAGWINVTSNRFATKEDFVTVLKSVTRLWIKAEFSTQNADRSDLDDVELLGQPSGPLQPNLAAATFAGVKIDGAVGASYRIEFRGAFDATNNWQKLADVVLPTSPYLFIDLTSPSASARFYRAVGLQ